MRKAYTPQTNGELAHTAHHTFSRHSPWHGVLCVSDTAPALARPDDCDNRPERTLSPAPPPPSCVICDCCQQLSSAPALAHWLQVRQVEKAGRRDAPFVPSLRSACACAHVSAARCHGSTSWRKLDVAASSRRSIDWISRSVSRSATTGWSCPAAVLWPCNARIVQFCLPRSRECRCAVLYIRVLYCTASDGTGKPD